MKNQFVSFKSAPLVILGGGVHQIPYILYCKQNHINTLVVDQNRDCPAKKYCDYLLCIKTPNNESVKVYKAIKKIALEFGISGVLVAGVELAILGSFLARKFKTKSIGLLAAKNATNKIDRAKIFRKNYIPYANFEILKDINFCNKKYPFVLKTEEGSGSRGVRVISSEKDHIFVKKEFSALRNTRFLIEEFIRGEEISIEAFIYKSKFNYYCFAIRDIELIANGNLIEHGSIFDPNYDKKKITQIKKVFEKACLSLGLNEGPVKGDIFFTISGPKVIEVAARSAPLAPIISKDIYGFDMISNHIKWSMGEELNFKTKLKNINLLKPVCHKYLLHRKGILNNVTGINKAKKSRGIIRLILLKNLEYPLKLKEPNNTNRLLYVVATGSNVKNAKLNADISLSNIKLSYK